MRTGLLQETESWRQPERLVRSNVKVTTQDASCLMTYDARWNVQCNQSVQIVVFIPLIGIPFFFKVYWGFIVVVWSLSLRRTSLFPSLLEQIITPCFQQGKYLTSCFSHQPAGEDKTVLLHFAPEMWHCTAYIPSQFTAKYWSKIQSWLINLMSRALKI